MLLKRYLVAASCGFIVLPLAGCASFGQSSTPKNVNEAIHDVGGSLDSTYRQQVLLKDLNSGGYSSEMIYLVQVDGGKNFKIIDSRGMTFGDFDDFLRNNTSVMSTHHE
jgi:hypothetical protein